MLLEGKNAVIYGGGGSIGGAVARAFRRHPGVDPGRLRRLGAQMTGSALNITCGTEIG